jgi:hypothetical protein
MAKESISITWRINSRSMNFPEVLASCSRKKRTPAGLQPKHRTRFLPGKRATENALLTALLGQGDVCHKAVWGKMTGSLRRR